MWHKYPILSPERTHGNSVTQMQGQVTLSEDDFLFINCTYSTTWYSTLFWYVQYPGEGPQLLFKVPKANEKGSNRGFEATYNKEATSFHLQKASVQESDSAVYYCALGETGANTGKLTFGHGTILRVHPSKWERKWQHGGEFWAGTLAPGLKGLHVVSEPRFAYVN